MSSRRLRFVMSGTGDFAPYFAPYLIEVADLVAIFDPNPTARAQFVEKTKLNVQQFDDYEAMLDRVKPDAVAITGPNFIHKLQTVAAAERGIHVFCEKAMSTNVPDCWAMARACEKAGVKLMVGHKRRLRPPWAEMLELRENLGPVYAVAAFLYFDARPYDFKGWWTREAECGGLLDVSDVHTIEWMNGMCGPAAAVSALFAPQIDPRNDFPDTIHVLIRYRSGATGVINSSMAFTLAKFREACGADVICRDGSMRLQTFMDHIDLYWQRFDEQERHHRRFDDLGFDHAFRREIGDFVRWVTEGKTPCLTWREGLRCVEVMEAAHRSAKQNGAWQSLPLYPELEEER